MVRPISFNGDDFPIILNPVYFVSLTDVRKKVAVAPTVWNQGPIFICRAQRGASREPKEPAVAQLVQLLPLSEKVTGLNPGWGLFCVEFACSGF